MGAWGGEYEGVHTKFKVRGVGTAATPHPEFRTLSESYVR